MSLNARRRTANHKLYFGGNYVNGNDLRCPWLAVPQIQSLAGIMHSTYLLTYLLIIMELLWNELVLGAAMSQSNCTDT